MDVKEIKFMRLSQERDLLLPSGGVKYSNLFSS